MPPHVLEHEPHLALFVEGDDPLLFYKKIAEAAEKRLKPGGSLFFECNEFNAESVADGLRTSGWKGVELRNDLSGAPRMVHAVWHP
jgi:release factor glutamine methyltransferase